MVAARGCEMDDVALVEQRHRDAGAAKHQGDDEPDRPAAPQ